MSVESTGDVEVKTKKKLKSPKQFNVVFFNDDKTPMDFVVRILIEIFAYDLDRANKLMLQVHNEGKAIAGTYVFEIAKQKKNETLNAARNFNYPLKVELEEIEC